MSPQQVESAAKGLLKFELGHGEIGQLTNE